MSAGAISLATSFNILGLISSGPKALWGSSFCSWLHTPSTVKLLSRHKGTSLSSGEQRSANSSSVNSTAGLNADWNCWLSISSGVVTWNFPPFLRLGDTHVATTFQLYQLQQLIVCLPISSNMLNMGPVAKSQGMLSISLQGIVLILMLHVTRLPQFLVVYFFILAVVFCQSNPGALGFVLAVFSGTYFLDAFLRSSLISVHIVLESFVYFKVILAEVSSRAGFPHRFPVSLNR